MSKLRPVKSALSMTTPKGSLIAQINNLRKELKDYKQVKKQDTLLSQKPMKDISSSMNKKSPQKCITSINGSMKDKFFNQSKQDWKSPKSKNTTNWAFQTQKSYFETQKKDKPTKKNSSKDSTIQEQKQVHEIELNSIQLKEKDRRLKMDIQINKLRKTIIKLGPQEIAQQLNYIVGLLNGSIKEYLSRIEYLQKNQKQDSSDQALLIKRQQEQIQEMTRKISQNQQQIRNLSFQLKTRDDSDLKLQQLQQKVQTQKQQLRVHVEALQTAFKESQMKAIQFQEQNRILQTKLMKKQEQLIMLNEDINYLRIQTENYKEQKKEFSQLYQNTLMELRQVKRAKTSQIEKLTEERLKWENECKLRRNESEQLTALEEQKLTLIKQLTEMRHLCSLKTKELQDKKALLHENQRKMITLESEVYKLKSELQTIKNQNEFAQFQNQKLRQQLQDIKKYTRNNRSKQKLLPAKKSLQKDHQPLSLNKNQDFTNKTVLKQAQNQEQSFDFTRVQEKKQSYNKKLREKQDKLKTLEDIHSLIKKHRKQMQI